MVVQGNLKNSSEKTYTDKRGFLLPVSSRRGFLARLWGRHFSASMAAEVLSAHFSNGLRLDSPIELLRFRNFVAGKFGKKVSITDDELKKTIAACGISFHDKIYAISPETEERIISEIDAAFKNGCEIIFYEAFYEKHEGWLLPAHIISAEMLQSILPKLCSIFTVRDKYLTNGPWGETEDKKIEHEIMRVWGADTLLNYEQFAERLPYIPLAIIKPVLAHNDDFIGNSRETFTHISKVDISEEERREITGFVEKGCNANGYVSLGEIPPGEIAERNTAL